MYVCCLLLVERTHQELRCVMPQFGSDADSIDHSGALRYVVDSSRIVFKCTPALADGFDVVVIAEVTEPVSYTHLTLPTKRIV